MADARSVTVKDATGAPMTSGAPSVQAFDAVAGTPRVAPPIEHLASVPGVWRVTPTDADEEAGTVVLADFGTGSLPRFVAFAVFEPDNSNQFWAVPITAADGEPWSGAAPTWGGYTGPTPPTLTAIAGAATALYVARPSASDIATGAEGRIDGPSGSAQPDWSISTEPSSPWVSPSPGPLRDAAADVAAFLDGKSAGSVQLVLATNLFIGPMRSGDRTTSPAVACLGTGGPGPESYLGGRRTSLYRPTVQVLVRGPAGDDQAGEALARGVLGHLHQAAPAGYVTWLARDSAPAYLGPDTDQHGLWSINVECLYRAALA